jgi:guanine deaminase
MNDMHGKAILGSVIHAPTRDHVEFLEKALLLIDKGGKVIDLIKQGSTYYNEQVAKFKKLNSLIVIPNSQYVIPGFVDLHIHAPQWPQLGKALDVPLEVWLQKYTFPLEAKYEDTDFAMMVYSDLVASLLKTGTTTAVYYGTIHQKANQILTDVCLKLGQRAIVGKVVMDNPEQCPTYYRDLSTQNAIDGTAEFINYVKTNTNNIDGRVQVAVTPRFIPSCTDEALYSLGTLASQNSTYIQTHCSESDWEHNYVIDRCGKSDTEALLNYGLLNRSTILAHANFISENDMDVIKEHGAGIAHCPLSNFFFSDAVFPLRRALEKGLRIGLGTDISGGPSSSILDATRNVIIAARALENGVNSNIERSDRGVSDSRVNFSDAFYLATKGGADVLNIPTGSFERGNFFDALLIDTEIETAPISLNNDSDQDIVQKLIMLATRANIVRTWVSGSTV